LHSEFWLRSREMENRWIANQNIKWPSDFIQNNIESRLYVISVNPSPNSLLICPYR
jgi:hypothetical protein